VFFIFLVSNIGGALTPLGDPPLFLGFLKGVSFFWTTTHLFSEMLVCAIVLLALFYAIDSYWYRKEGRPKPDPTPETPVRIEGGVNIIQTAPTVSYQVMKLDGTLVEIHNPADLPDMGVVAEIREPIVKIEIICPNDNIGDLMKLCDARRGCFQSQMAIGEDRQMLIYELPLAEIIYDFYDKLKSVTRGYGTMDYEIIAFRADNLVKVQILVNGDAVEALAMICHRENADQRSRSILAKLKGQIDRHQFEIPLQAAIGGKIIARESIKSMRKNVIAKCYGGDISRKRKLLEKQKAGKKRMKQIGSVSIPQEAFMAILDQGD
jgi:GTP-binding protein LepA